MLNIKTYDYAIQDNLSWQHNDNVLREKKISCVSDEEIHWLGYIIAAACTNSRCYLLILAVEKNKILHHPIHIELPYGLRTAQQRFSFSFSFPSSLLVQYAR